MGLTKFSHVPVIELPSQWLTLASIRIFQFLEPSGGISGKVGQYYTVDKLMRNSKINLIVSVLVPFGSLFAQVEPNAGNWQTWILSSGNQMRLAAPPNDAATAAEAQSLKQIVASGDDGDRAQIAYW